MGRAGWYALFGALISFASGCGFSTQSEVDGLALDPGAQNVAGLFTMTNEGGRMRNLDLMESVLADGKLGFKPERHHNVSSTQIYQTLTEMARRVGENGTLLVYFNSHGGGSGSRFGMMAKGGFFKFSKALSAIAAGKKVRRLVVLIDTCHAEGGIQEAFGGDGELLRNMAGAYVAQPGGMLPELPANLDYGNGSAAYQEALVLASSSVEDLSMRGMFASRLSSTFKQIANAGPAVTVGDFLKKFADAHGSRGQQPHYKVLPDASMMREPLFGSGITGGAAGGNAVPVNAAANVRPVAMALKESSVPESFYVAASAPAAATRAGICFNTLATCLQTKQVDLVLAADESAGDLKIFRSASPMKVSAEGSYTILAFDSAGAAGGHQVKFTRPTSQ